MKFKKILLFVLFGVFALCGCQTQKYAISASVSNITGAGSTSYTFSVNYQEEKDYEDKYTDIMLKSSVDNQKLKLCSEQDKFFCIKLEEKDVYYSLTKLIANAKIQKTEYLKYQDVLSKNYIFSSEEDGNITIKVVVGDLNDQISELKNMINISKELVIDVKNSKNN